MLITVRDVLSGRQFTIDIEGTDTVEELKKRLEEPSGTLATRQRLSYDAVDMLGSRPLADYKLHLESELLLIVRPHLPRAAEQGSTAQQLARLAGMGTGLENRWKAVATDERRLEDAKQALLQANGGGKLKRKLRLNVGGQILKNVKRETLCFVPGSRLAQLFSGRWETKLLRDAKGNIFLDVQPEPFAAIIDFLADRKLRPDAPLELPTVSEELEPALHRQLDFFGLGELFAEPQALDQAGGAEAPREGVPPEGRADPEPEPAEEERAPVPTAERELIAADNEQVELPARTVDCIRQAKYGVLDQDGMWADVTRLVYDAVDEDGGLSLRASSATFGVDPAPAAEKRLSVRYKPCEPWEAESFETALQNAQAAADAERLALRREIKAQRCMELDFEQEQVWVRYFTQGEARPSAPEVVQLDVGSISERVCVKRSTLMLCPESAFARRFDAATWAPGKAGGDDSDEDSPGSEDDDDDDEEDGVISIEEDPYCFRKLVDQLRLVAIAEPGDPPPPPIVEKRREPSFAKVLDYYFPGDTKAFIMTEGQHRPPGATLRKRGAMKGAMPDSEIALAEDQHQIAEWVPEPNPRFELLFRASRDGWTGQDFHAACDRKGATVTVVRSEGGHTFGGYADRPWQSSNAYAASPGAFLFGLRTARGEGPVRLAQGGEKHNPGHAVHDHVGYGPTFGGGHDLYISTNANATGNSYASLGHSYSPPPGGVYGQASANEYMAGARNFKVADYEVFRVVAQ